MFPIEPEINSIKAVFFIVETSFMNRKIKKQVMHITIKLSIYSGWGMLFKSPKLTPLLITRVKLKKGKIEIEPKGWVVKKLRIKCLEA